MPEHCGHQTPRVRPERRIRRWHPLHSKISDDVCEFLREQTQNNRRVLTIQTAGAAVDTSLVWHLLQAGASDVLVWSSAADTAARIKARFERWNAIDTLIQSPQVQDKLIGASST